MAEIVHIERLGDVVELVVRRGDDLARYGFTDVPVSVLARNGARLRADFPRPEDVGARIMLFAVARQAFRGTTVPLPFVLP
jgi:hypothetical protein